MKNFTHFLRQAGAVAALVVLVGSARQALAQGSPSSGTGGPEPTAVPLDGGASLLLAGGVAYGLRKLRQRRRK